MGAPIERAQLAAVCDGTAAPLTTATDTRGEFAIELPRAVCLVSVTFDGFRDEVLRIDARDGDGRIARQIVLQIAGLTESVSVSGAVGALDLTTTRTPT